MRPLLPALALGLTLAACSAKDTPRADNVTATDAANATTTNTTPENTAGAMLPTGKSPITGFKGHAEHWSITIGAPEGADASSHKAELVWGSGSEKGSAMLAYKGPVMDMPSGFVVLSGELQTKAGVRLITVELKPEACTDDGDQRFTHSVSVHVEGLDLGSKGCGNLTPG